MELLKYKIKEENHRELMNKHRELIFKRNYGQKIPYFIKNIEIILNNYIMILKSLFIILFDHIRY
jgi:hypothetical protein